MDRTWILVPIFAYLLFGGVRFLHRLGVADKRAEQVEAFPLRAAACE